MVCWEALIFLHRKMAIADRLPPQVGVCNPDLNVSNHSRKFGKTLRTG